MKTVIIGSGNIAAVFGEKIVSAGHELCQLVARSEVPASALARTLGCPWTTSWAEIDRGADLYLAAISDSGLGELATRLSLPGKLVVHTAGSAPAAILAPISRRCGVIWPLQSLRAEVSPHPPIPLVIDSDRSEDLPAIAAFANTLSGMVETASAEARLKLHLAATLVNNFTNYLYTLAAEFCDREKIDFDLLLPLIRETARRLEWHRPEAMQTGPAVRGDRQTIDTHVKLLHNYQDIRQLYELFSIQIEEHYRYERTGKV